MTKKKKAMENGKMILAISRRDKEMLEKAIRYTISTLQYERHQALAHGCKGGVYDAEIEEYRQLKQLFQ